MKQKSPYTSKFDDFRVTDSATRGHNRAAMANCDRKPILAVTVMVDVAVVIPDAGFTFPDMP